MKLVIDIEKEWYERACKATMSLDGALPIYQSIKEGIPYEERPQWIPCSERLPEDHHLYLVTIKKANGITFTAQSYFFTKEVGWSDACVTAWMPFPKPYREAGETE